jgi:hypothetical protein
MFKLAAATQASNTTRNTLATLDLVMVSGPPSGVYAWLRRQRITAAALAKLHPIRSLLR